MQVISSKLFKTRVPIPDNDPHLISDIDFIESIQRTTKLYTFLVQETIQVPEQLFPNEFRVYKFQDFKGRAATAQEWQDLEKINNGLFGLLDEPTRRRYMGQQIPTWFPKLAGYLCFFAAVLLILSVIIQQTGFFGVDLPPRQMVLPIYVFWLLLLGALGSIASIGFNAIAVSDEITFDINNRLLLLLRMLLGALFALIITIPFGFNDFIQFTQGLLSEPASGTENAAEGGKIALQAVLLLLPFILGYSTSLTIVILNRFLSAIKAFFGVTETNTSVIKVVNQPPVEKPRKKKTEIVE